MCRSAGRGRGPGRALLVGAVVAATLLLTLAGCSASAAPTPSSASAPSTAPLPTNPDDKAVLSPLAITSLADPVGPVLGADNRIHLAYELQMINESSSRVELSSVSTLGEGDAVITTLQGADLQRLLRPAGGSTGAGLGPGQGGELFLDATLPAGAPLPRVIRHRFALTLEGAAPSQEYSDPGDGPAAPATRNLSFDGVPIAVSGQPAVVVAPPLRGGGWVAGNGCCDDITAHRGATLSVDGTVRVAQRFAIDFVQIGANGTLYNGNPADNASFPFFGTQVLSAAEGTVARVLEGNPNQPPGSLPTGQTLGTADGNYVVVDIGNGRFAFYAHMQPGSIRVKVGDHVGVGDVLGLLGNSGNTDAPHLHFHIMDGPSPLQANGLPYVFSSFTGQGVVTDEQKITAPFPPQPPVVPVDPTRLAGPHTDQLPLNLEVISFG